MCFGLPHRRRDAPRAFPWLQHRTTARQRRADGAS
jgi:hypothetical protein